jgi:hypothetical protein
VVCCCKRCNRKKAAQTLRQAGMVLRKQPIQPDWLPVLEIKLNGQVPNSWQEFLKAFSRS